MPKQDLNIELFASLFNGRKDVFAKRWLKDGKSGYAPAYNIDWNKFLLHKAAGGTLKDYPDKTYLPLTNETVIAHIEGKEVIGIYPLLNNNTSWFAAIDFDEKNWQDEILKLYRAMNDHRVPAYIERSRSGNGGHLWIFFSQPYPADKSRTIIKALLQEAAINITAKNSSYDRIFPNQDFHSGKGLGNLIALPFQKQSMQNGNSCFIDPLTFQPYIDQWNFLHIIERVDTCKLDELYHAIAPGVSMQHTASPDVKENEVEVILEIAITVFRKNLPPEVVLYVRESLRASNPNYFIKKATGQNTYGIAASSSLIQELADRIIIPRGFIGNLLRHFKSKSLPYHFTDKRKKLTEVEYQLKGALYDYQAQVLAVTDKKEMGVIVAPPGAGKTIIALAIVAQKKQPALIIVHRRQLFDQWVQSIQSFLGIPKYRIGKIMNGRFDIGEQITVAMIQSLDSAEEVERLGNSFGTIIIDECHHAPAESYSAVLQKLHTYYLYGMTATPVRKNKDEKMIFVQIGEVIHEVRHEKNVKEDSKLAIFVRDTDLNFPYNEDTDKFEILSDILIHDTLRNTHIVDDIRAEINNGKSILILTERKAHIEILNQFLKRDCETITLSGADSETSAKVKFRQIQEGRFQVLISTGQFIGEGTDIGVLDCLFIVYPCSFEGKLIQYLGRIQRSENAPALYDYRDLNIPLLERMFQKRNRFYNKLVKAGTVRSLTECFLKFEDDRFYIDNQTNAYPLSVLDLNVNVERFHDDVTWKIRISKFDEEKGIAFAEILSYNSYVSKQPSQLSLSLLPIEQIKFRTIDTSGLLRSVVLKKTVVNPLPAFDYELPTYHITEPEENYMAEPTVNYTANPAIEQTWTFERIIKIPFQQVRFKNGGVEMKFYLSAIGKDIDIEISNADVRAEFESIKDYFAKVFKTKSVNVQLSVKHNGTKVLSYEATSEEINEINAGIIDSMKFEFVKKNFMKFRDQAEHKAVQTFDDLLHSNKEAKVLLKNETAFMDEVLKMESARHFLQVKFLAARHEASILKLRFILQPFSFIFLLAGENKYHLVWETLDSEEATYHWRIDKNKEALRSAVNDIEIDLLKMKEDGRIAYLKNAPPNFSRIIHDYADVQKGFIEWKGLLEERLV